MFFDPKMLLRFGEYLIEREHDSDVLNNGCNRPHMPLKQNYAPFTMRNHGALY